MNKQALSMATMQAIAPKLSAKLNKALAKARTNKYMLAGLSKDLDAGPAFDAASNVVSKLTNRNNRLMNTLKSKGLPFKMDPERVRLMQPITGTTNNTIRPTTSIQRSATR